MARLFSEERSRVPRDRGAAPEWAPARERLRTECAAFLEGAPGPILAVLPLKERLCGRYSSGSRSAV